MLEYLWLIPALPLFGFLVLALFGARLSRLAISLVGVGTVFLSALLAGLVAYSFLASPPPDHFFVQKLWTWIAAGSFSVDIAFHLDALSLVMTMVVTGVGFLIHLYSTEFMAEDPSYARFFAYLNLFVASMLTLVLGDNLLLLYFGWEGVGLCSYLLIGFWYQEPKNGYAARKAFIVTRVGDTGMAIGLFLLFAALGTLNIQELMSRAELFWPEGATPAVLAASLLLIGALGKSGQLPLQVWLPDAMAGPTPVSALIHAATMVTAGVYLIARTNVLFTLAPVVQTAVAVIGTLTLFVAGCSAFVQRDMKRILAYSTISQIGYMFLALGVGAWSAAMFHFMTHAFFKALLFLAAGAVIMAVHHEHDIFKMGGLRKKLPIPFWTFLAGAGALAGVPLITSGFYSKDLILWYAFAGDNGSPVFWFIGWFGAFLTALYSFRLVFVTFFGKAHSEVHHKPGLRMSIPLVVLAALALIGGFVELPHSLGHVTLFSEFMNTALPTSQALHGTMQTEIVLQVLAVLAALGGIGLAYLLYVRWPKMVDGLRIAPLPSLLHRLWFSGWGFDYLYDLFFVRPYAWLARINARDFIDRFYDGLAKTVYHAHLGICKTQTGRLRWYAASLVAGTVLVVALVVFQ